MLTLMSLIALAADPPKPLVEYPHPLITEVLYAVPTGDGGDANGDGKRETNGDEFVELVNPHERSISLRGYILTGKSGDDPQKKYKTLRFVFPPVTLQPGEVVVVFNGYKQTWTGPVGTTARAPDSPNDKFSAARVFTMEVESARLGLSNKADYILLTAPGGEAVQCVKWGDIKPPAGAKLVEDAPQADRGSVTRRTPAGPLEPHPAIDGKRFSPGRFPFDQPAAATPEAPPQPGKSPAKPGKPPTDNSPKPPSKDPQPGGG